MQATQHGVRYVVFGVEEGLQSSHTHLYRPVWLSHECMGQSITSIRAHGPEQCRFRAFALHLLRSAAGEAARVAIAVLMPFHSITTTDSVERISGGLAKSPSEVLNPPSSSLKAAGGRV